MAMTMTPGDMTLNLEELNGLIQSSTAANVGVADAMTAPDWGSVKPMAATDSTGRGINPYETFGPAWPGREGQSWHDYFKSLRVARTPEPVEDDDDDVVEGEIVVTREAEEFDEPVSALAKVVARAHKAGWQLHTLAHAYSTAHGKPTKSGPRKGIVPAPKNQELQWAFFEKPGVGRAVVSYLIVEGMVNSGRTYRSLNGRRVSDADLTEGFKK